MPDLDRRDLLKIAFSGAAVAALPSPAVAQAVWAQLGGAPLAPRNASEVRRQDAVAGLADTLLPRTDTPGALDVNAPAFVALIVRDHFDDDDRARFDEGLAAIDGMAADVSGGSASFASLDGAARARVLDRLEANATADATAVRAYRTVKRLVVHGYFTSERVQRDVLKTQIMHARYVGDAPV